MNPAQTPALVRTRFAPSPTGSLHVGGARTALYCRLYAHAHGGQFLLRIEDTDQQRSTDEATLGILRDLEWIGIRWDEGPGKEVEGDRGPWFQSKRLEIYDLHVQKLLDADKAYEAWETREELEALRVQAEAAKDSFKYRRRRYTDDEVARFRAEGRKPVVRVDVPKADRTIDDRILGSVTVPYADVEDFVIRKADGYPTYHFAVVVDDYLMDVTLVLRGQEHLMNTSKHLVLYEAFGWDPPEFAHLPLIFNPQGAKMSKREKARIAREAAREAQQARVRQGFQAEDWTWLAEASNLTLEEVATFVRKENDRVSVADAIARVLGAQLPMIELMDFRKAGYIPEALANYLALLGWAPGDDRELMSMAEIQAAFDLERVNKTAARFDYDKVEWMNHEYMKSLPVERLQEVMAQWLAVTDSPIRRVDADKRRALLEMYKSRCATFARLDQAAAFFFKRPASYDDKAVAKHLHRHDGLAALRTAREVLAHTPDWTAQGIEAALAAAAGEGGVGKLAQPVRVALTGTAVSPAIGDTVAFFDRTEVLERIDACLAAVVPA